MKILRPNDGRYPRAIERQSTGLKYMPKIRIKELLLKFLYSIAIASPQTALAQEIKSPSGRLFIGMSVDEAERVLGGVRSKYYYMGRLADVRVAAAAEGWQYHVSFCTMLPINCSEDNYFALRISKTEERDRIHSDDEVESFIKENRVSSSHDEYRYDKSCAEWRENQAFVYVGLNRQRLSIVKKINELRWGPYLGPPCRPPRF